MVRLLTHAGSLEGLDLDEQRRLLEQGEAFLRGRAVFGVSGLRVGPSHRALVALTAARMVRGVGLDALAALRMVAFFPNGITTRAGERAAGRTVRRPDGVVSIELCTWDTWLGLALPDDGHDVLVHELAHVLDLAGGGLDGRPPLGDGEDTALWDAVVENHLSLLRADDANVTRVLRAYAGTNAAELFAVASEVYFERRTELAQTLPALHWLLARFYGQANVARA